VVRDMAASFQQAAVDQLLRGLDDAVSALEHLDRGDQFGKVVLRV